jgi:P pilus assembly chaperone PapD
MMPRYGKLLVALAAVSSLILHGSNAVAQPGARLGISPERYVVQLGEGGAVTESLMVKNLSQEPITIDVSVGNWELDENNRVKAIPPRPDSLDRWIVINPSRVTIPPNTPQTIRWAIMPRSRPQQGEYRAIIYIQEDVPEPESNASASVRLNMRMGIPVYAQVGKLAGSARIDALNHADSSSAVQLLLDNESNRHARLQGQYGIWRAEDFPGAEGALDAMRAADARSEQLDGFSLTPLSGTVVLPGNRRTIVLQPGLPVPGSYIMQLDATFGNASIQKSLELGDGKP